MISVYGKQKKMKEAVSIFNSISNPDAISFSSFFHACSEYRYDAMSANDSKRIQYIDKMAWNIFQNHFIKKHTNHQLSIECVENKLTMSAMFDLFIKDQQDETQKIQFEKVILNAKSSLLSYYPLPIASFLIHETSNIDDHKLNEYVIIHTTNKKYIGINDNLCTKLMKNTKLSQNNRFDTAIQRAFVTMIECYQCEYFCVYINHGIDEQLYRILRGISIDYDSNFYVMDKHNKIHQFCSGLCMKGNAEKLNENLDHMVTRLKSLIYSPDTDQKAHHLWQDIYQTYESSLTSEMYEVIAQLLLNMSRKGKISQNQCVRGLQALIDDMEDKKDININFGMMSRLLSSYMYLCGNRDHISHGIVNLSKIQNIWQYVLQNEETCDITVENIHALMYLFGYFKDNETMLNIFSHYFPENGTNNNSMIEIQPNHQTFHTMLQYQDPDDNPRDILDIMVKK